MAVEAVVDSEIEEAETLTISTRIILEVNTTLEAHRKTILEVLAKDTPISHKAPTVLGIWHSVKKAVTKKMTNNR